MKRRFRLRSSTEFKRVRQIGKSSAHPLLVLVASPTPDGLKIGVTAGRSVGSAVERNRAKRRLRAAIDQFMPRIPPGWNIILIARQPILKVSWPELLLALQTLLKKARLLEEPEV